MGKELDFDTPEQMMDYIQQSGGQNFQYMKWSGGITTSHNWGNQAVIVIHWRGTVSYISSLSELIEMYKRGTIFMIKESIEITYKPFAAVKKRKITEKEYAILENSDDVDLEAFDRFLLEKENQEKFEAYLIEQEQKKKKPRKPRAKKVKQEENLG